MIIGLVGTISSGKDTVAGILSKRLNYPIFSFSDILAEELKKRKLELTRKNFQDIGDELRKKYGSHILSKMILERSPGDNIIMNGFRNPEEINYIKKLKGKKFILIAIDAPPKLRFERMLKRGRAADLKTFDEFLEREKRDMGEKKLEYGQNVKKCIEMKDYLIINDGSLQELEKKIDDLLKKLNF